jgi:hypothetical protein
VVARQTAPRGPSMRWRRLSGVRLPARCTAFLRLDAGACPAPVRVAGGHGFRLPRGKGCTARGSTAPASTRQRKLRTADRGCLRWIKRFSARPLRTFRHELEHRLDCTCRIFVARLGRVGNRCDFGFLNFAAQAAKTPSPASNFLAWAHSKRGGGRAAWIQVLGALCGS